MPYDDLAAILVVGGRSSRMGRPKPWLDFDGAPLLVRLVERVRTWADEILLVAAPEQDLPALPGAGVRVLRDVHPDAGPLPALALGLGAIAAPWALVLGCDAPLVRSEVVARLLAARSVDDAAVIPVWEDRPQPLVALYCTRLAGPLTDLVATGERRLRAVMQRSDVRRVPEERLRDVDPEGESFWSMNRPTELARVLARWRRERAAAR